MIKHDKCAAFESRITELEEQLKKTKEALKDFVLTFSHADFCGFKIAGDYCNCMDRSYYNPDACRIRAEELLGK